MYQKKDMSTLIKFYSYVVNSLFLANGHVSTQLLVITKLYSL